MAHGQDAANAHQPSSRGDDGGLPYRRLVASVMAEAASVYRRAPCYIASAELSRKRRDWLWQQEKNRVAAWVKAASPEPFGFAWCCDALGLDLDMMAAGFVGRAEAKGKGAAQISS